MTQNKVGQYGAYSYRLDGPYFPVPVQFGFHCLPGAQRLGQAFAEDQMLVVSELVYFQQALVCGCFQHHPGAVSLDQFLLEV